MSSAASDRTLPERSRASAGLAARLRWALLAGALYVLGMHVFVGLMLLSPRFEHAIDRRVQPAVHPVEFDNAYKRWSAIYARVDAFARPGALIFLGDSIMRDLDTSAMARHTINLAIPGDTTARVLRRMVDYKSVTNARGVVLSVGVNDLAWRPVGEALTLYRKMLDTIPQRTPVIMVAVLPIDERLRRATSNADGARLNEGLGKLCQERLACRFLDLGPRLRDSTGNLDAAYHGGDGIHLSAAGHEIYWRGIDDAVQAFMPPSMEELRLPADPASRS